MTSAHRHTQAHAHHHHFPTCEQIRLQEVVVTQTGQHVDIMHMDMTVAATNMRTLSCSVG